jgi:hypothetical protein
LGVCANYLQKGGSLAEYAVAPITSTVKRPPIISPVEGASVPVTGLTALQSAKNVAGIRLDGSSNLNVLITAASGGVGTLYVQVCIPASCATRTKKNSKFCCGNFLVESFKHMCIHGVHDCWLLFCLVSKARRLFCNSNLWCSQHGPGEEPRS